MRCDRPTSGAIDDRDHAARRSTSGARPTSAISSIAPRDLVGAVRSSDERRDLGSLSLSFSGNDLKGK